VAAGGALQHVTILAAHPGTTVVVQADYYSPNDLPSAMPVLRTNAVTPGRPVKISPHSNAIELYARTQGNLTESRRIALLDVHA
jgi:hypothetical protein